MKTVSTIKRAGRLPVGWAWLPLFCVLVVLTVAGCAGGGAAKTAPDAPVEAAPAEQAPAGAADSEDRERQPRTLQEAIQQEVERAENAAEAGRLDESGPVTPVLPQPEDGEWLVDDEGRQYFVRETPKIEGRYRRLDDGRVRLKHGLILDVVDETEESFFFKVYRVEPKEVEEDSEPTAEEIAAVEAEYRVDLPVEDRLRSETFGDGLPQSGQWRNGADFADMNGDGHIDLVHASPRRNPAQPFVLLGDGAGAWEAWQDVRFPASPFDYGDVEAADFDGDGVSDVAVGIHLGGVSVFRGDGAGGFTRWAEGLKLVPAGAADAETFLTRTVGAVDWDEDGDLDLVGVSEGPRHPKAVEREAVETPAGLVVFDNRGDGTWKQAASLGAERDLFADSLVTGDFDGDGRDDLATGANVRGLKQLVYLNRDGWEAEPVIVDTLGDGAFVWSVSAADFDGDGLDDLVTASTPRRLARWWLALEVHLSRPSDEGLRFERVLLAGGPDAAGKRITAVTAGDVDGDGHADVVAGTDDGRVQIYLGDGGGGFVLEDEGALDEGARGCRTYHLHALDLDGAPGDEVVAGIAGEQCPGGGSLRAWRFHSP